MITQGSGNIYYTLLARWDLRCHVQLMPSKQGKQNKNTCRPSYEEQYLLLLLVYILNTLKMRPMLGRVFRALFLGK